MTFDINIVIVLEYYKLHPYEMANNWWMLFVFWLFHQLTITPFFTLFLGSLLPEA